MHARIIQYIKNFEAQLDDSEDVALTFQTGEINTLLIMGMGYFAPDIIAFYGRDEKGNKTHLIQHYTQVNVKLKAVPTDPDTPQPRRIGFAMEEDLKAESNHSYASKAEDTQNDIS